MEKKNYICSYVYHLILVSHHIHIVNKTSENISIFVQMYSIRFLPFCSSSHDHVYSCKVIIDLCTIRDDLLVLNHKKSCTF